jgi:hypothetical protein
MLPNTFILAIRSGRSANDAIEALCLRRIDHSRYRLYTTTLDTGLIESDDDLLPVEFENAHDPNVTTLLIESFWRIDVSESDIDAATGLLADGVRDSETVLPESDELSLRCFGPLLANLLAQLASIKLTHLGGLAMVGRISRTLTTLSTLPYLHRDEQDAIESARRAVITLEAELKLKGLAGDA